MPYRNLPIPLVDFEQSVQDATGQLAPRSARIYQNDAARFAEWLQSQGITMIAHLTRSDIIRYRAYLDETYAKATAARMLSIARRILGEQVIAGELAANPAKEVKGWKLDNESTHLALTKEQAKELLASIDHSAPGGLRDFAICSLLIRTGLRRLECTSLNVGDISEMQGHTILTVQHGKGDKRRTVKLPVDVFRALTAYMHERGPAAPDAPLFVNIGTRWKNTRISDKWVERMVAARGRAIGIDTLKPHDLRATFITLAIEGGATLVQTQYAAGHSSPITTERYHTRKLQLDDNAVDYIKL